MACGSSQARGQIGAVAAGLQHSGKESIIHEEAGSIPGPTQLVKDLELP